MPFDAAFLAGDGIENLGDAVADIIAHHVAHEESCYQDTDDGVQQVEPVGARDGEVVGQQVAYLVDDPFQQQARQRREYADDESQEEHELLVPHMALPPLNDIAPLLLHFAAKVRNN